MTEVKKLANEDLYNLFKKPGSFVALVTEKRFCCVSRLLTDFIKTKRDSEDVEVFDSWTDPDGQEHDGVLIRIDNGPDVNKACYFLFTDLSEILYASLFQPQGFIVSEKEEDVIVCLRILPETEEPQRITIADLSGLFDEDEVKE